MVYKPKILAFAGSLRPDSYNKKLVKIAGQGVEKAGGEVTYIDLRDYPLPLYDQVIEDSEGLPQNALKLKELFMQHQGLLISSPEYNSSMSAVLKNTIDWVSRQATPSEIYLECFFNKVAVIMSASPGGLGGLRGLVHLRDMLGNINIIVMPQQKSISNAPEAFTPEGELRDPKQTKSVQKLGEDLVNVLKKLNS